MEIQGIIEDFPVIKMGDKKDGSGQFKRIGFKINGLQMSTFNEDYEKFTKGDLVNVEYEINGQYNNIKTMEKVDENASKAPQTAQSTQPNYYDAKKETEASIVSQVILKTVTEMVNAGKIEPGAFKANAKILVDVYKETKSNLLK